MAHMDLRNEKVDVKVVASVVSMLLGTGAHTATKYLSPTRVVRATRQLFKGKINHKGQSHHIILTVGEPNSRERDFVKRCQKAAERFPVRKIQVKFPPKKK